MNPLYFGTSERPLFGVYHPPKGETPRNSGILLCYPFGHEYMRSHRAFRQLSLLLSRAGYHVFRFDYTGTGDSGGASEDCDIRQWQEDIDVAIEELQATAGIEKVSLVGLRLGAALALRAAHRHPDVDRVVLWDPIVQGEPYIQEILDARSEFDGALAEEKSLVSTIHGFPLTETFAGGLGELDLLSEDLSADDILIVVARELPQYAALAEHLRQQERKIEFACVPAPDEWNEVDNYGSVLLPQPIIQMIVNRFAESNNNA